MTTMILGTAGLDFNNFSLLGVSNGAIVQRSNNTILFRSTNTIGGPRVMDATLTGVFSFDPTGQIVTGNVLGLKVELDGVLVFQFSSMAVPVSVILDAPNMKTVVELLVSGNDTITGSALAESLSGLTGVDRVFGGDGNDTIDGGEGVGYLRGEVGNDKLSGGAAFDDLNGNQGNDTVFGGGGDDWTVGGKDDDLLSGDDGGDIVYGNLGNDWCDGGAGADLIRGGQDNDVLLGQAGDDWLSGDRGDDTLTGGAGADTIHSFGDAGVDRVTDFNRAQGDKVLLDLGTTYSAAQSGADVVITMGGGGQVILVGVQLASLTGDWITLG